MYMTMGNTGRKRVTMLRVATLLVTVLMFSFVASAATPTTVTFWHALGADHQKVLNEIIAEFNAANPDVVVKPEYQGNWGALQQALIAAVAAKRAPTMSLVYNNWTAAFLEGDAIVPVSSFLNDPHIGLTAEEIADFVPSFVAANSWDGDWKTMPFAKSIYVMYYNADLLEQAGVGVPETMDEFVAAVKAVAAKTEAKGLAVQANVDQFGVFLSAFGGQWVADGRSAFNDERGVAALKLMQDLILRDKAAYYHDGYLDDEFNAGETAMFFATTATIPWLGEDHHRWGAAATPATATQASVVQGTDVAIFKQATVEQQRAAWRFLKFFTSPDINAQWAVASGYLPSRQATVETKLYQDHVATAPDKYASGVSQLATANFDPGLVAWIDARNIITEAVEQALLLGTDPKVALDAAAKQIDALLGD